MKLGKYSKLDDAHQSNLDKIKSIDKTKRKWRGVAIGSGSAALIGGILLLTAEEDEETNVDRILNTVDKSVGIAFVGVSIPIFLGSSTGWAISSSKHKKQINEFVDGYNQRSTTKQTKLNLQISTSSAGLVLAF